MECTVAARLACSGELLTVVDMNMDETVASLRNAIAETARESCSMWLLASGRLLLDGELLRDTLTRPEDGRFAVDIVRCEPQPALAAPPAAPTNVRLFPRCALTGEALGEVQLWPLDTLSALREAVRRRLPEEDEGPVQLLLGEHCLAGPISLASAGLRDGMVLEVLRCEARALFTASADHTVRLWDAELGTHLGTLPQGEWATSLEFHVDTSRLAVGLFDCSVKIWSYDGGFSCERTLNGHRGPVMSVAFSGDGQRLASGSFDHTAKLWSLEDGRCLRRFDGHSDGLTGVTFGDEGLLSASVDSSCKLWRFDAQSAAWSAEHPDEVNSVKFTKKECRVVTSCGDHHVRLWDGKTGTLLQLLSGFPSTVSAAVFSPNGCLVCATGADGQARLWDLTGELLWTTPRQHQDVSTSVAFSADGQCVATTSSDGTARLWNIESQRCELVLTGHQDAVMAACFVCRSDLEVRKRSGRLPDRCAVVPGV
ncbi:unnamed protein product [Durusdinium trenchii]|uniref:Uncharacterized protein n=2 Tax=Durusdinium trenchii TaxID=1381693 RepID=A0ABP0QF18_9DINO